MFNPVAPYRYLLPTVYLSVADIANPDLLACGCRISLDIAFMRSSASHPAGPNWPACLNKTVNRAPIAWGGRGRHNLHSGLPDRSDSSTACSLCRWTPFDQFVSGLYETAS